MNVAQALAKVRHFLHDAVPEDGGLSIVNDTGEYMHTIHQWTWASGMEHPLAIVAGTKEYQLPENVRDVMGFVLPPRHFVDVAQTTWEELVRREQTSMGTSGWYTVALRYDSGTGDDSVSGNLDGHPRLVMRVWPAPSITGTMIVMYRRGWRQLRRDDDIIGIPDWMIGLFDMLLRAFALGYYEDDVAPLHQRLDEITGNLAMGVRPSAMFWNCMTRDGSVQDNVGPPMGGAGRQYQTCDYGSSRVYPGRGTFILP